VRALLLIPLAACSSVEVLADVGYDDRFGASTTMDVYLPDGGGDARPAVMMIHGGGWYLFSKDVYAEQAERFAGAGYVAASINYRLVPEGSYPRLVQDAICALAFLRAHAGEYGLDPERVAVLGYSAGGHMASLLGVGAGIEDFQPDCAAGGTFAPAAVVSGAGPQDLRGRTHERVVDFLGCREEDCPERWERASPIAHVKPGAPPYLLAHGSADLFVDVGESRRMQDALQAAGVEARLFEAPAGGHLLTPDGRGDQHLTTSADTPEAWAVTIDFLDRSMP
jgi:acetyl esterase/lipase